MTIPTRASNFREYPHITENEARAIWSAAKNPKARLLIKILWFTGLRISEVLSLKVKDISKNGQDFDISVVREKQRDKKPQTLPVVPELGFDIIDFINSQDLRPSDKLIALHRSNAWRQVQNCAKRAGLGNWKDIHPHSFRHGFVYNKVKKGVDPYVLSKLAGHVNINSTLYYYHPTMDDLREAMEK